MRAPDGTNVAPKPKAQTNLYPVQDNEYSEYNGIRILRIPLYSCIIRIPLYSLYSTPPQEEAADRELRAEEVEKWDTDSDSDKSDDEKELAV